VFHQVFAFPLVELFGRIEPNDAHCLFDELLTESMENQNNKCQFPKNGTIFDYFIDFQKANWGK
jgi:hypothetical protein